MIEYNNLDWDLTDKQEVDMINAAIEVALTPIHALDSVYDAGMKLLQSIEDEGDLGVYYHVQTVKMENIEKHFRELADRVATLRYKEAEEIDNG